MSTQMKQLGLDFAAAPERQVFTVGEITAAVRDLLEGEFFDVWIAGEISNTRKAPSGHFYFTLKDKDAQIRCVCFRQNALYLKMKPQDGLAVLARGHLSVYEARGEYQLYVEHLEPQGFGALQLAFEQLKRKLASEGLFDDDRKRLLPVFPQRIGIVTSAQGAVIADMLRIIERRFRGLHLMIYPVSVQGDAAAGDISRALAYFSRTQSVDVVIVGRGGGSLEDLWPFNEESVARAIAACEVPVISAVGHQTDFTIADFVADYRAPTPSAAAEVVIRRKSEFIEMIAASENRLVQALRYKLAMCGRRLVEVSVDRPAAILRRQLGGFWQRMDEADFQLRHTMAQRFRRAENRLQRASHSLIALDFRLQLARQRSTLAGLSQRLGPAMTLRLERLRSKLDSLERQREQLSPLAVLERGYSIVRTASGTVVRAAGQVSAGDTLQVRLHQGRLGVRVAEAEPE